MGGAVRAVEPRAPPAGRQAARGPPPGRQIDRGGQTPPRCRTPPRPSPRTPQWGPQHPGRGPPRRDDLAASPGEAAQLLEEGRDGNEEDELAAGIVAWGCWSGTVGFLLAVAVLSSAAIVAQRTGHLKLHLWNRSGPAPVEPAAVLGESLRPECAATRSPDGRRGGQHMPDALRSDSCCKLCQTAADCETWAWAGQGDQQGCWLFAEEPLEDGGEAADIPDGGEAAEAAEEEEDLVPESQEDSGEAAEDLAGAEEEEEEEEGQAAAAPSAEAERARAGAGEAKEEEEEGADAVAEGAARGHTGVAKNGDGQAAEAPPEAKAAEAPPGAKDEEEEKAEVDGGGAADGRGEKSDGEEEAPSPGTPAPNFPAWHSPWSEVSVEDEGKKESRGEEPKSAQKDEGKGKHESHGEEPKSAQKDEGKKESHGEEDEGKKESHGEEESHGEKPKSAQSPAPPGCDAGDRLPEMWAHRGGGKATLKVLTYNLFWWNLFGERKGDHDKAAHLIRDAAKSRSFDLMGFQECENVTRVLRPAGLMDKYHVFSGSGKTEAICIAASKASFDLLSHGIQAVGEDSKEQYFGKRSAQWMRLKHKKTGQKVFFMNHHGPLPVNSGGVCGGRVTAYKLLQLAAAEARRGDAVILVGDFNAGDGSTTVVSLEERLHRAYHGTADGGIDNFFSNLGPDSVIKAENLGSGGSDHDALSVELQVGGGAGAPPSPGEDEGSPDQAQEGDEGPPGGEAAPEAEDDRPARCGVMDEGGVLYSGLDGEEVGDVASPADCCSTCSASSTCKSWTWKGKSGTGVCSLWFGLPEQKDQKADFISGLPPRRDLANFKRS